MTLDGGNATEAIKFIGGAAALREQMGTPVRPIDRPILEQMLAGARTILGEEIFMKIWSEAQTQPLERLLHSIPHAILPDTVI